MAAIFIEQEGFVDTFSAILVSDHWYCTDYTKSSHLIENCLSAADREPQEYLTQGYIHTRGGIFNVEAATFLQIFFQINWGPFVYHPSVITTTSRAGLRLGSVEQWVARPPSPAETSPGMAKLAAGGGGWAAVICFDRVAKSLA